MHSGSLRSFSPPGSSAEVEPIRLHCPSPLTQFYVQKEAGSRSVTWHWVLFSICCVSSIWSMTGLTSLLVIGVERVHSSFGERYFVCIIPDIIISIWWLICLVACSPRHGLGSQPISLAGAFSPAFPHTDLISQTWTWHQDQGMDFK